MKCVKGYEGIYSVAEDGTVYNSNGKVLSPYFNKGGYPCVKLYKKGKRKTHLVHRLVAIAHVPNKHPRKWRVVLHLDDDPSNPHKDNLAWGSASMNMLDMISKGRGKNQFERKTYDTANA